MSPETDVEEGLTPYHAMEVLKNERRAAAFGYTYDCPNEEPWRFNDIVAHVCEQVYEKPRAAVGGTERNRIYVSLYQLHIPKMEEMDVLRSLERPTDWYETGDNYDAVARVYQDVLAEDTCRSFLPRSMVPSGLRDLLS